MAVSRHRTLRRSALLALATLWASLAAAPAAAQPTATAGYRLGPQDLVRVEVEESATLNADARLSAAGTITLPVLGEVEAVGLTAAELAAVLEERLEADYLARATVRVEVLELKSQSVSVLGAVARPGSYGFAGEWALLDAIGAAGGLSAERGDTLHVVRRAANGLSDQVSLSLPELMGGARPELNLPLFPDDVIRVEARRQVTVYLLGEVAATGAMEFQSTDRVTLLTALARAGGLSERASPRISVQRLGADGTRFELEAHYGRILQGRDPDLPLQDGDIIVVKESFF